MGECFAISDKYQFSYLRTSHRDCINIDIDIVIFTCFSVLNRCHHIQLRYLTVCVRYSATMGQVYSEHKDEDGFLYVAYSGENTFGY